MSTEEYLEFTEKALSEEEKEFFNVPLKTLLDLLIATNYLDYPLLLNTTAKVVARMIDKKTPSQICQLFNIKEEEITQEEKDNIMSQNPWLQDADYKKRHNIE